MILKACTDVPDFKKYITELGGITLIESAEFEKQGASPALE
jgi:hypothetical protein